MPTHVRRERTQKTLAVDIGDAYPGYRAEAQVLGQDLFHLRPNPSMQFLYFVSVVSRYVPPPKQETPESLAWLRP